LIALAPARPALWSPRLATTGTIVVPGTAMGTILRRVSRFLIRPNGRLSGSVDVHGAKNSVLKCMAACLLAPGRHRLENVPAIADVTIMSELLSAIGLAASHHGSGVEGVLTVEVPDEIDTVVPYEQMEAIRASIVILGPLLARTGRARISLPGGDDFGGRPIDMHLRAFEQMGAEFITEHGYVEGICDRLKGARVVFEFPSHTATDNVMMAAVLAKGTTIIENAAREPEVADLAGMLRGMGAQIEGDGTSRIEIEGVDSLSPAEHICVPDRVEAATFLGAVGLAGGEVFVRNARPEHMDMLLEKLRHIGVHCTPNSDGILVSSSGTLTSVDVSTLPYPGVATDYKPMLVTLLSAASGVAIVTENVFAGRFRYIDELRRMGARISREGHHVVVRGVPRLSGTTVQATDIRAGAALVTAGLVADGTTEVGGAEHVDRGYENLAGRLKALGADIERIQSEE
ncbi:MAG: UDP-N-acetylglucosamine 1-carboxyvinyltransferase, partial [Acidimicrobiales bacterium]